MKLQVVIVAYNAPAELDCCLSGLRGEIETVVVDNSSSAEIAAIVARHDARYVDPGANLGFAAGVNLALRTTPQTSDVLLLNPDAVIAPDAARRLHSWLREENNARVAAVTPSLHDSGGKPERVWWPFPSPWRMCAEAIGIGSLPSRRHFVIGAVLLLRREALEAVGGFDERFFLYAEEVDWQLRASKLGWRSALCPTVEAEHAGGATSEDSRRRELLFHLAHESYMRKWYGSTGWYLYRVAACAGAAARMLVLRGERRASAARRALLYLRGPSRVAARQV
ncbi:MAG: glycosyltransferase family 2 protein [Solirubrobacteraceae bacterium]